MKRNTLTVIVLLLSAGAPLSAAPGCATNADCIKPGWVCEFPLGDCLRENGVCSPTPTCNPGSGPVCGCDDDGSGPSSYANACDAFLAGDVVAALGTCPTVCSGQVCPAGMFCEYPPGDCARENGVCLPSSTCDPFSEPVCGCDDDGSGPVTYADECEAFFAGDVIAASGECPGFCGGQFCVGGEFCQLPDGVCRASNPQAPCNGLFNVGLDPITQRLFETMGTCVPVPTSCEPEDDPVCACNGVTYSNRCEAAQSQQTIVREGTCSGGGESCGGLIGLVCNEPSDICVCGICLVPDIGGGCEPEPTACDNTCAPVCDCGGTWHRNRCEWIMASPTGPASPITLSEPGGCGEAWGVQFIGKTEMRWVTPTFLGPFNVYRATLSGGPPSWGCVTSGLIESVYDASTDPPPGEVWAYVVTRVENGVEGPLGWAGSACAERMAAVACPN